MFDDDGRRLVQVASIANAIGAAENAAPWRALVWLAGEVEGGGLAPRLYIPVRMRTVGTTQAPPDASLSAWRSMAKRAQAAQMSPDLAVANRDSFMPAAASTWHVHVNDLLQFVETAQLTDAVRAELRELAQRYRGSMGTVHGSASSEEPERTQPAHETPRARQARRLGRLRELGGDFLRHGSGWRTTGGGALASLVREEAAAGRPMADKSDVRADLAAAMDAETGDQRGS